MPAPRSRSRRPAARASLALALALALLLLLLPTLPTASAIDLRTTFPFSLLADPASGRARAPLPVSLLISDACVEELVFKLNLAHAPCVKDTLARSAGWAIVVLSGALKVPMVVNVVRQRSAVGLDLTAMLLETSALMASFASSWYKGFPISIYGEVLTIGAQNLLLLALMETYEGRDAAHALTVFGALGALQALAFGVASGHADLLVAYATACMMLSRGKQIWANFSAGHTGVLSIITQGLMLAGVLVRFATVLHSANDPATVASLSCSLVLNAVLAFQVVHYRERTARVLAEARKQRRD